MIVVDSTGWIEYFTNGILADDFARYLDNLSQIFTPTIILYEVYKIVKRERGEQEALIAAGQLLKTNIVTLDSNMAMVAADYSLRFSLPMADAIVYATAIEKNCTLITSDEHFANLDNVTYIAE